MSPDDDSFIFLQRAGWSIGDEEVTPSQSDSRVLK
jgi:hypothetical protein